MGQLIKLEDYVSRYEQNIYHYPTRFVRLKKQQWEISKENWESPAVNTSETNFWEEDDRTPFLHKFRNLISRTRKEPQTEEDNTELEEPKLKDNSGFAFSTDFINRPLSEEDLKIEFLDQLFRYQLKWATSTITEKSHMNPRYFYDKDLKFFIQRFPDNFLIIYRPIFLLKKAPTEAEIILISPTETWCISFLESEENSVFQGTNDHFWLKRIHSEEKRVLNPLIALNRTYNIVKQIYQSFEIDFPIRKVLICRNGYLDFPEVSEDISLLDKRNFEEWFQSMRMLRSPIKHIQLKSAQVLLQYCQTTSYRRPEWDLSD